MDVLRVSEIEKVSILFLMQTARRDSGCRQETHIRNQGCWGESLPVRGRTQTGGRSRGSNSISGKKGGLIVCKVRDKSPDPSTFISEREELT